MIGIALRSPVLTMMSYAGAAPSDARGNVSGALSGSWIAAASALMMDVGSTTGNRPGSAGVTLLHKIRAAAKKMERRSDANIICSGGSQAFYFLN
jgi:hypothetical protein